MMAAIALRRDGWQVVYLGSDAPIGDAVGLAYRVEADVLGISLALEERVADLEASLRDAELPPRLELLVCGAAATPDVARRLGARCAESDLTSTVAELRTLRTG